MSGALGDLVIGLHVDLAQFQSDMGRAARISEREWKKVADHAAAAARTMGNAAAIAAAAMAALTKSSIDAADQAGKMAQRFGVSVEGFSELAYAGKLADVSVEALGQGLKKLSVNMVDTRAGTGEAKVAFDALGISVEESSGKLKTSEKLILELADKFSVMKEGADKTALAAKIFGQRIGPELLPLLNQGAAGLRAAADEARKFGIVISTDTAKAAEEFNDNITRMQAVAAGLGQSMASVVLPGMVSFTNELASAARAGDLFKGTLQEIMKMAAAFSVQISKLPFFSDSMRQKAEEGADFYFKMFPSGRFDPPGTTPPAISGPKVDAPRLLDPNAMRKAEADAKRLAAEFDKRRTFAATQWTEEMGRQAEIMSGAAQATADYQQRMRALGDAQGEVFANDEERKAFGVFLSEEEKRQHQDRMNAWFKFIDAQRQAEEKAMLLAARFDENGNKIQENLTEMGEFAKKAARNMQDAMATGFFDIMQGKFGEMGANFKAMIDRMVANALAAKLAEKMFGVGFGTTTNNIGGWAGELIKIISGGFGGRGITSSASMASMSGVAEVVPLDLFGGFATGTDYVPETGPYLLHKGEAVLTAEENSGGGRGAPTIYNTINVSGPVDRRTSLQIGADIGMSVQRALARNG